MNQETWTAVDACLCDRLIAPDPALENALRTERGGGLASPTGDLQSGQVVVARVMMALLWPASPAE